jgi:uncharacterized protein
VSRQVIIEAAEYVKASMAGVEPGHDWWHIQRVCGHARRIGRREGADLFVVELAALFHDIADHKLHQGHEGQEQGLEAVAAWLRSQVGTASVVDEVVAIVSSMGFTGAQPVTAASLNAAVVQDADRLDALGAIGIARAFSFGGSSGRTFYDPAQPPRLEMSKEEYRLHQGTVINHFYEKLLLLEERMNTDTGRSLAAESSAFMRQFLDRFFLEWRASVPSE